MKRRPSSTGPCPFTVSVTGPVADALNRHIWSPLAADVLTACVAQSRISAVPPETASESGAVALVVTVKGPASWPAWAVADAGVTVSDGVGSEVGLAVASATMASYFAFMAAVSSVVLLRGRADVRLKPSLKWKMAAWTAAASRAAPVGSLAARAMVAAAGCWSRMRLMFCRLGTVDPVHGVSVIGSPEPVRSTVGRSTQYMKVVLPSRLNSMRPAISLTLALVGVLPEMRMTGPTHVLNVLPVMSVIW